MRDLVKVVFVVVLIHATAASGATESVRSQLARKSPAAFDSPDVTLSVELESNGAEPTISIDAAFDVPYSLVVYASLEPAYPWHANAVPWSTSPACADPDTTGSSDSAGPRHCTVRLPEGWEGDVVHVVARIKSGGDLVHVESLDAQLDPPLELRTIAWVHDYEPPAAAIAAGLVPDLADSSAHFDAVLEAQQNIRYAVFDRGSPTSAVQPTYSAYTCMRSRHDAEWTESAPCILLWYNMEFLPADAEILYSKLFLVNEGGPQYLMDHHYITACLDTVAADETWLSAPSTPWDPYQLETSFEFADNASAHPWSPDLDERDDLFEFGPVGGRWTTSPIEANTTFTIDLSTCDQAYVDAGDDRVNAGYFLVRTSDGDGLEASNGFGIELGVHAYITQQPIKIMQYVVNADRDLPWGVGCHRIPIALILDDVYDIHAEWAATWGEEFTSFALNGDWVDGYYDPSPGHLTGDELIALRENGVRMIHHGYDHSVGMGDISEPAKWYWQTRRTMFLDVFGTAYGDTVNRDINSFVWIGAGQDASMPAVEWLVDNAFTSSRGYTGTLTDGIGTQTPLSWYGAVSMFHLYAWGIGNWTPEDLDEALEIVGEAVDEAVDRDHECLVWWTHTEIENMEFDLLSQAVDAMGGAYKIAYADAVALRAEGETTATPNVAWLPDPHGIDSVWLGGEEWKDHCWYPPRGFPSADPAVAVPDGSSPSIDPGRLFPNSPNPFNPTTEIRYEVARRGRVEIRIYDVRGRLVRRLLDAVVEPGVHVVTWDGRDGQGHQLASGVYLYRLDVDGHSTVRKAALLR